MANSIVSYTGTDPNGSQSVMSKVTVTSAGFLSLADIKSSDTYTLRLWIKASGARTVLAYIGGSAYTISATTSWQVCKFTAQATPSSCDLYLPAGTYYIWHPKLERSSKASDYSPAPEDVDENIEDSANAATNAANAYTDGALQSYSTTAEMRSEINQTRDEINLSVTEQITQTRTYADRKAAEARTNAGTDTDTKLQSYVTTTTHTSDLQILSNQIATKVSTSTFNSLEGRVTTAESNITQNASAISSTVTSVNALNGRMTTAESNITQNAKSISLKVTKGDVVSEINQSSDTISLTAGRLIITSGNFKLDSSGSVTATNVNLSGSIKTERSDGYYTHIHDGIIEMYLSDKHIAYMMPVGSDLTQFAILGSGNYDGIAIGAAFNDSIETYYRCNIQNAASSEGCRHHFIGSVKFDDTVNFDDTTKFSGKATFDGGIRSNANIDFANGYGISLGGDIAFRWATKAEQGVDRNALWIGMHNWATAITGSYIYIYGDLRITDALRFLDISSNTSYTAMWHDSYNRAFNVGNGNEKLFLKGSTIYANNSPIATSSDERVKRNIADLDDRYLKLMKNINPVSFKYIENLSNSNRSHTGFIAQDVLTAMNDAGISSEEFAAFVDLKGNGSEYALRYEEFISPLLMYIKHLESRISALERTG